MPKETFLRRKNKDAVFWGLIVAAVSLFISWMVYPFVGTADGFNRWGMAIEICNNGKVLRDTLLSPVIPYIQAGVFFLTHSYAFYTWLQCIFFYLGIGFLANYLLGDKMLVIGKIHIKAWLGASILALCVPVVNIFPALLTDSALIFPLISLEIWMTGKIKSMKAGCLVEGFLIALTVAIRINSLMLFCGCIIMVLFIRKVRGIIYAALILISCVVGVVLPPLLLPSSYNAISLGMTWELVGIISESRNEEIAAELEKYGDVEEAIKRYNDDYLNAIVWDNDPPFPAKTIAGEHARSIIKLYLKTAIKFPLSFWKTKLHYISRALGINAPLLTSARGIHGVDDISISYGAMPSPRQYSTRTVFFLTTDKAIVTMHPWLMICIVLFITKCMLNYSQKTGIRYGIVLFCAIMYYTSFLVNTQAHEYRYYAPSFYLMLVAAICSFIQLLARRKIEKID